jgi:hypothetical protein
MLSIRRLSIRNPFETKLMTEMHNFKDILNKEFEYGEELYLSSGANQNIMHLIWYWSIRNPFQKKLMKRNGKTKSSLDKEFEHSQKL